MTTAYGVINTAYERPSNKFSNENIPPQNLKNSSIENNKINTNDTEIKPSKNSSTNLYGDKKAFLDDHNNNQVKLTKVIFLKAYFLHRL